MQTVTVPAHYIMTKFFSEQNSFTIGVYKTAAENIPPQLLPKNVQEKEVAFSAKGTSLPEVKKFEILFNGVFKFDKRYGLTLDVNNFKIKEPTSIDGIQQYLSDMIKGCGKVSAKRITDAFGKETLNILKNNPEKLYEVPKLRKKTVDNIITSYNSTKEFAELITLLAPFDITTKRAIQIQTKLQNMNDNKKNYSVCEDIKSNPFILTRFKGFSFDKLDCIAKCYNCDPRNGLRIKSAIFSILKKAEISGNLCLPQKEVAEKAYKLLNYGYNGEVVTAKTVCDCMCFMAKSYDLLGTNGLAYLSDNFYYEQQTAIKVVEMLENNKNEKTDIQEILSDVQKDLNIELSKNQKDAVEMVINNNISIITGGAGTGKTTVLNAILNVFYTLGYKDTDIVLCSPTGKAAGRMQEATKHTAKTIHSTLHIRANMEDDDRDDVGEDVEILNCKLIVCDEFSMCDQYIAYRLFKGIDTEKTKVLLIGDTAQLPSVGAGDVLNELIKSDLVPVTELNVIYRQAADNKIVENATNIRMGIENLSFCDDFSFWYQPSPVKASEDVKNMYFYYSKLYGADNVQVLSPLRNKGDCATLTLNKLIQESVNPPEQGKKEAKIAKNIFRLGDRVIQTKNVEVIVEVEDKIQTISINNGDTGIITRIFRKDGLFIDIDFGDNRKVTYTRDEMLNVELSYALTVHKSQGSEYKLVIIPMLPYFSKNMLFRNLLYTAVTRAKEKVIIVGDKSCIYESIKNNITNKRYTQLAKNIKERMSEND